jgi:hypothetical protein
MVNRFRALIPLVAAVVVIVAPTAPASGGWWDDLFDDENVTLEKVLKTPEAFRGHSVCFAAQFHKLGRVANPFYTKFESDWYLNFSVWGDGAPLWEKPVYKTNFPYMFVRRGSESAQAMLGAPLYSRWIFTAEVVDVFNGMPWIEVTGVKRLETQLDEPALVHLVKGAMLRDLGRFDVAAQEFRAADHKGLPVSVRIFAMREEALALHHGGKTALGIARVQSGLDVAQNDPVLTATLTSLRSTLGLDPDGHPLPATPDVPVKAPPASEPVPPTEPAPPVGTPSGGGGG